MLIGDAAQTSDEVKSSSYSSPAAAAAELGAADAELVSSQSDVRLAGLPAASESSSIQISCGKCGVRGCVETANKIIL